MLGAYKSHQVDEVWHEIFPYVKRVLNRIDLCYSCDDIKTSLLKAEMQLWTSYDGTQLQSVCITQIVKHPKYKYLEIVLMAGSLISLPELEMVEQWAKDIGCKKMKLTGRKGWEKVLPDYKQTLINLEKEI